jgi:hypothetical protein
MEDDPPHKPPIIERRIRRPDGGVTLVPTEKAILQDGKWIVVPLDDIARDGTPGAQEKCLPPSAEERPQSESTPQGGSQVTEDKPRKPIPREAERVESRLLYVASKAQRPETGTVKHQQDPGGVEWVIQWTYGAVPRLAEKLKIGVEKWEGYPPEEIKESYLYREKPTTEHLKTVFGEFIVKDRDFRVFTLSTGKWMEGAPDRIAHEEEVCREREKRKKALQRAAARPEPPVRPPPTKTDLDWDIEMEVGQVALDKEFKHEKATIKAPPRLKKPKRK